MRAALKALVLVLLLAACEVRTEVAIDVDDDGSGTVAVGVGLDEDASARVPRLADELRLDDLREAGWSIEGPAVEADGLTWVRATKPFGTPEEAGRVLAEVAGEDGPFRDFAVTRSRSFARTRYGFEGTVDFSPEGLEAFGDAELADALDGEPLGEDIAAIEARIGAAVDEVFDFRVAVRLPGDVSSNAPTQAENGAVWRPSIAEDGPIELRASSEVWRPATLGFAVAAVAAGAAAIIVLVGWPIRRRRRGRHAARS